MPVGPYTTFAECVTSQKHKGKSEESARKICGAIEQKTRSDAVSEATRRRLRYMERRKKRRRMPPELKLRRHERVHTARIMTLIEPYETLIRKQVFPLLDVIVSESRVRVDDPTDIIERIFNGIRVRLTTVFTDQAIERAAQQTALGLDKDGRDLFRRQFRTVFNTDPLMAEPWLAQEVSTFVSENASLISTLPTEAIADIEQMIFREGRRGASPQEIRSKILEQFKTTEARATLIARDQVAKFNGRLSELRQKQTGITRYTWQTSEDGRVRDDHERLNGKVFDWDDPPITVSSGKRAGERNHPGQDIQCRCQAIPVVEDLI